MEPEATELPLFPLGTVLYPGGWLPLRIFEPRYLDMVRECARSGSGFGIVCQFADEDGNPQANARIGTEAMIGDFYTTDDGLLGITVFGKRRFAIEEVSSRQNGLIDGRVVWLPEPDAFPVPPEYGALANLLNELIRRAGKDYPLQADTDNAVTLAWRLAELLPFETDTRQDLLEQPDPRARLDQLLVLLQDDE